MSATHRVGILLLVGFAFILGSAWQFAGAQGEKTKAIQKWEYISIDSNSLTGWNKLGDEGWELVTAYSYGFNSNSKTIIFKRPTP